MKIYLVFFVLGFLAEEIYCHGMFLQPPSRSSLWRFNSIAPINYNDNGLNCGGFDIQYRVNGGKCGVCGDSYSDAHPQNNENTGKYGKGIIAATYHAGSVIDIKIKLTANHLGTFTYSLCKLANSGAPEPGEHCFKQLQFADGSQQYYVSKGETEIQNKVRLPHERCERCVLRWHYRAGNNWGDCGDGTSKLGCGPQETFRGCSDISIV